MFFVIGLFLFYLAWSGLLNTTVVTTDASGIAIRHQPLPWPGLRFLPRANFTQLFVEEKIISNRRSTTYSFQLMAVSSEGKKMRLITGLTSLDQAKFFESKIEERLGIENRQVEGEKN
jgi:hypothetical protein